MAWAIGCSFDRLRRRAWWAASGGVGLRLTLCCRLLTLGCLLLTLGCLLLTLGCLPQYSPWSTDVPAHMQDLNARNLAKIQARPLPGDEFEVLLVSDPQRNVFALRELIEIVNARPDLDRVAFVLILGDVTDYGLLEEYLDAYKALAALKVPFLAVPGNHDSISHGKEIYRKMFGPYDQAFDFQGTRFVLINSNSYEFDGAPDLEWLAEQALAAPDRHHRVLVGHAPVTEDGEHAVVQEVVDLLARLGVRYHLAGHLHLSQEVVYPQGVVLFVVDNVAAGDLQYARMKVGRHAIRFERCQAQVCTPVPGLVPSVRPLPPPGPVK